MPICFWTAKVKKPVKQAGPSVRGAGPVTSRKFRHLNSLVLQLPNRNSQNVPYKSFEGHPAATGLAHVEKNLDHVRGQRWLRHEFNNVPRNQPVGIIKNISTGSIG